MLPRICYGCLILIASSAAGGACAEIHFHQEPPRSPRGGRPEILGPHQPQWTLVGPGAALLDAPSGWLQASAAARSPVTGRLEYVNQYFDPWTGARYVAATQYNPFVGRYETMHHFAMPSPQYLGGSTSPPSRDEAIPARPKPAVKVIEAPAERANEGLPK